LLIESVVIVESNESDMYKFPLKVALIILCSGAYASDLDKYAEVLDWRQKWEKVIARTTGNYVNRHIRGKLQNRRKLLAS